MLLRFASFPYYNMVKIQFLDSRYMFFLCIWCFVSLHFMSFSQLTLVTGVTLEGKTRTFSLATANLVDKNLLNKNSLRQFIGTIC